MFTFFPIINLSTFTQLTTTHSIFSILPTIHQPEPAVERAERMNERTSSARHERNKKKTGEKKEASKQTMRDLEGVSE
jgi:hypothetical protein